MFVNVDRCLPCQHRPPLPPQDTHADDLLATVLAATLQRTAINPADVGDIVVGSVLGNSSLRATECRIAAFYAGFPDSVPVHTVRPRGKGLLGKGPPRPHSVLRAKGLCCGPRAS